MNIRFLIKYTFKNKKNILLLLILTTLYIFFIMNFLSVKFFKYNCKEIFSKSYPADDGFYIWNNDSGNPADLKTIDKNFFGFLSYLDKSNYIKNYRFYLSDSYPQKYFKIDYSKYREKAKDIYPEGSQSINTLKIDKKYYEAIKKYVSGYGFTANDFNLKGASLPVILGMNFKHDYKVGQVLTSVDNKVKLKVVGFLNENLFFNYSDPVSNSIPSEGSFILPLNRENLNYLNAYKALDNLTIQFDTKKINYKEATAKILEVGKSFGFNFEIGDFNFFLNDFFKMIDAQININALRTFILTILAFGAFSLSLLYSINEKKKDIGILYSFGAKRRHIILMVSFETVMISLVGYLISIPLFLRFGRTILEIFMDNYTSVNIRYGLLFILLIDFLALLLPCYKIIKLKPRELIGGFRE